jgi:hypothetical protein
MSISEPGLSGDPTGGSFNADEERFFAQGESLEQEDPGFEEAGPRRPRWRPRVVLAGGICVALLAFLIAIGKDRPADTVATVNLVPAAQSAPLPPAPVTAPSAPAARPVEEKQIRKISRAKAAHHPKARRH